MVERGTTAGGSVRESPDAPTTYASQLDRALREFLDSPGARLVFNRPERPAVSVVVVVWNKAPFTFLCLASLLAAGGSDYELIVVDNASSDETGELLRRCDGVAVIRNADNEGFVRAANAGAARARGRMLLFLNNDAMITPGALDALVSAMELNEGVGAVGAKLVWPDGRLQEAGSIIWKDGSAQAYGRGDDPARGDYGYLREVDYCSGAALLVDRGLFERLGGFDEGYGIAYYEDADLCMAVWAAGLKVLYQPKAVVVHHEFTTSTPSLARDLCQLNRPRFAHKWRRLLADRWPPATENILFARDRRPGEAVLVFDDRVPTADQGCGYGRSQALVDALVANGNRVTFVPLVDEVLWPGPTERLTQAGIEVLLLPPGALNDFLASRRGLYSTVIVSRPHNAERVIDSIQQELSEATIIYDAEALYYRREILAAEVAGSPMPVEEAEALKARELELLGRADAVVCVSSHEAELVQDACGADLPVHTWGFSHPVHQPVTPFAERSDLLFVGSFLRGHPPNRDAVRHFASEVLPRIRVAIPGCRFIVVGASPTDDVLSLDSESVLVKGFVEDLAGVYEAARLVVVPLRFGAGINYKVTEAMSFGVPVVASTVAAEGLGAVDGEELVVARDDDAFVDAVCHLYHDEEEWGRIQAGAIAYVRRNCDPLQLRGQLAEILFAASRGATAGDDTRASLFGPAASSPTVPVGTAPPG
jgi:GT2 family glycosyltransferase